ncbi:MAG: tannase/feruloyl esterase family alpha/beta hydrolase [Chloroflexota bacterium]
MNRKILFISLALCLLLVALSQIAIAQSEDAACEALKDLDLPGLTITAVEAVDPTSVRPSGVVVHGVWKSPDSAFGSATVPVPFCRVAGLVAPAINFEVWMPLPDTWNGKLYGVGNGGLSGGIKYGDMAAVLTQGYATVSTDSGHQSESLREVDWMEDRPDLWVDFGFRAVHESTRYAKKIMEAYYGQGPEYSYFISCSGGGQQALASAQKYPADYDGIVAMAPMADPTRCWPKELYAWYLTSRGPGYDITDKLEMINTAAIAACDADDGAEDGLIGNALTCDFDPASLLCAGDDAPDCLTAEEVDTVQKVYFGLPDPTTGEMWFPGALPGSELGWGGHLANPFSMAQGYFRWMMFDDPDWDPASFDFEDPEDFATLIDGDARYGPILNAYDPDLTAYNELGGKLILWHGLGDMGVSTGGTINYYNSVVEQVGSEEEAQEFVRLFLAPGVGHCGGGPGADSWDALGALEAWVEDGVAPDQLLATNKGSGITRPLCPYPQVAMYSGSGSTDDAENWSCVAP